MAMGIRLTVGKIDAIKSSIIAVEIDKLKAASQNKVLTEKVEERVEEKDLPKDILRNL
jgi:hypothetical protein